MVIPPANRVPHGDSTSQHSTTWWFHQLTQHYMVVPPANRVPHGGSTSQQGATWWFHQLTQRHMVVPPANTAPHGGSTSQHSAKWWFHQPTEYHSVVGRKLVGKEAGYTAKRESSINVSTIFRKQTAISQWAHIDETHHSFDCRFYPTVQSRSLSVNSHSPKG